MREEITLRNPWAQNPHSLRGGACQVPECRLGEKGHHYELMQAIKLLVAANS